MSAGPTGRRPPGWSVGLACPGPGGRHARPRGSAGSGPRSGSEADCGPLGGAGVAWARAGAWPGAPAAGIPPSHPSLTHPHLPTLIYILAARRPRGPRPLDNMLYYGCKPRHRQDTEMLLRPTIANAAPLIRDRVDFNAGTLHGHTAPFGKAPGQLPGLYHPHFNQALKAFDFYMVVSYETPIAWYADKKWYVPNVRYTQATSRHQSALGLVSDRSVWSTDALWARNDA